MTTAAPAAVVPDDPHAAARAALERARAEHQALVELLLALEDHDGARRLEAAVPAGGTRAVWAVVQERRASAWADLEAHRRTLAAAEQGHGTRPNRAAALAVTALLTGPAAARDGDDRPVARAHLVARVRTAASEVRALFEAVTTVGAALEPLLAEVGATLEHTEGVVAELGTTLGSDPCSALYRRLAALRRAVRDDPLAQLVGRQVRREPLDALRAEAVATAAWLDEVRDVQQHADDRLAAVDADLRTLDETDRRDALLCAETALKVRGGPAPGPSPAASLRTDAQRVHRQVATCSWPAVATSLPALERALGRAVSAARERLEEHGALLRERAALRARLGLYRAKAGHAGIGEDAELRRLHDAARDLLDRRPCDLAAVRDAVAAHDAAVNSRPEAGGPR